jgi:hypothetical protein
MQVVNACAGKTVARRILDWLAVTLGDETGW